MSAFDTSAGGLATAEKVRFPPIMQKSNNLLAQKAVRGAAHDRLSDKALRNCCNAGKTFAGLRWFWLVAARRKTIPHADVETVIGSLP
ncbi:MAG: hypothetical protein AAGC82_16960 [Pseudomonadota bacterium]